MLFVQCSFCRSTGPLMCAGSVFPHVTLAAVATPFGATCPGCGNVTSVFTCTTCMRPQYLLLPGAASVPTPGWGQPIAYAPVVQAEQGASRSKLDRLFSEVVIPVAKEAGSALVRSFVGQQQQPSPWGQP